MINRLLILLIGIAFVGCGGDAVEVESRGTLETEEETYEYLFVDVVGSVLYENKDTANDYLLYLLENNDTIYSYVSDSSRFFAHLSIGKKYVLGFKKEGYVSKHLVFDAIDCGDYEDHKYGFEFPMELKLIEGDSDEPSVEMAYVRYYSETGYMDYFLDSNLIGKGDKQPMNYEEITGEWTDGDDISISFSRDHVFNTLNFPWETINKGDESTFESYNGVWYFDSYRDAEIVFLDFELERNKELSVAPWACLIINRKNILRGTPVTLNLSLYPPNGENQIILNKK